MKGDSRRKGLKLASHSLRHVKSPSERVPSGFKGTPLPEAPQAFCPGPGAESGQNLYSVCFLRDENERLPPEAARAVLVTQYRIIL